MTDVKQALALWHLDPSLELKMKIGCQSAPKWRNIHLQLELPYSLFIKKKPTVMNKTFVFEDNQVKIIGVNTIPWILVFSSRREATSRTTYRGDSLWRRSSRFNGMMKSVSMVVDISENFRKNINYYVTRLKIPKELKFADEV